MTSHHRPKLKVAQNSIKRVKERIKEIMRKGRGRSLPKVACFGLILMIVVCMINTEHLLDFSVS